MGIHLSKSYVNLEDNRLEITNNFMRKRSLLYCIVFVLILAGCRDKKQLISYSIPGALKKACLFQKNSYWIYRNDSTGITDCTYVKTNPVSGSIAYNANTIFDYILTPIGGTLFNQFYISGKPAYGYRFYADYYGTTSCQGLPAYIIFNDSFMNHKGQDGCTLAEGKYPLYEINSFTQLGESSGFTVNNLIFDKVGITRTKFWSINVSPDQVPENDSIDFYYSSGNGLVKIILRIDTASSFSPKRATISWSLLKYNVVQ